VNKMHKSHNELYSGGELTNKRHLNPVFKFEN
jgi:hypothetical protein